MSFIRHMEEPKKLPAFKGGEGYLKLSPILQGEAEMYGKGRVFARTILDPGCAVGYHQHQGDSETFFILKGHGDYNHDGQHVQVGPGDIAYCGDGEWHGMKNNADEPLEFIALILYK